MSEQQQDTSVIGLIKDRIPVQCSITDQFIAQWLVCTILFDKKQHDYGPGNIAGYGTFGVVVRMNDKFERVKTLFGDGKKRRRAKNETIKDTLRDIANYAIIALMVEEGEWPK